MSTGRWSGRPRATTESDAVTTPPADDPDAIRADIGQTQADLGNNVQELHERSDVKARAQGKVVELRQRARSTGQVAAGRAKDTAARAATSVRRRPAPAAGVAAGLAALGAVTWQRRRAAKARARRRWWWSR